MKRLWIALALLLAILGSCLWNAHHLEQFTTSLTEQLRQAESLASAGHRTQAELLIENARNRWRDKDSYLHMTLRHCDTDQIQTSFEESLRLLRSGEIGEYAASTAHLSTQLTLVAEAEQLTLANLF